MQCLDSMWESSSGNIKCTVAPRCTNDSFVTFINLDQWKRSVVQVKFQSTIVGLVVLYSTIWIKEPSTVYGWIPFDIIHVHRTFLRKTCVAITTVSVTGNVLVCLAVYKNPKLRSTTNLYVVALAVSDLLCATIPMPFASAVLITGRRNFGDDLCQVQSFLIRSLPTQLQQQWVYWH